MKKPFASKKEPRLDPPDSVNALRNQSVLRLAPWLIAIPAAIAALVFFATLVGNTSLNRWTAVQRAEATLQILPNPGQTPEAHQAFTAQVTARLAAHDDVLKIQPLSKEDLALKLSEWLGPEVSEQLKQPLAIPDLFSVTLSNHTLSSDSARRRADYKAIETAIDPTGQSQLIDNSRWNRDLNRVVRLGVAVLGILSLLSLAAIILVAYLVSRQSIVVNRKTIAQLHAMGAPKPYLKREFRRLGWRIGWIGGLIGMLIALLCLVGLLFVTASNAIAFSWAISQALPLALFLILLPILTGGLSAVVAHFAVGRVQRSAF